MKTKNKKFKEPVIERQEREDTSKQVVIIVGFAFTP